MGKKRATAPSGLGKRIQRIVDEKGILKKDFAVSIGVSPNYIYQIIAGRRDSISEPLAKLIETLYGYPSGWVLHGEAGGDALEEAIRKLKSLDADNARRAAAFIAQLDGSEKTKE